MNYHKWYKQKEKYEDKARKLMDVLYNRPSWIIDIQYTFDEQGVCVAWIDRDGDVREWQEFNFVILDNPNMDDCVLKVKTDKQRREQLKLQAQEEKQKQQEIADKENRRQLFEKLKLEFGE